MKKYFLIGITIVVIICCVFYANQGKKRWRYAAAQSHIQTITWGTETYIKKHGITPTKIEDLVSPEILTQEHLNTCLVQDQPVKILSTNEGEYLIKYQHPFKPNEFFGVKKNGVPSSGLIESK